MSADDDLRLAEAAEWSNVTIRSLRLAIEAGDLAARTDGRRVLIRTCDLEAWAQRHGLPIEDQPSQGSRPA